MELGIFTFAAMTADPKTGYQISPGQRLKHLIEEIKLADEVGLDVFGVGEHHRSDYAVSAPAVALAAAASVTKNIKLTSAVTVLSSDDPLRIYQQFSTLGLLANGRAEIMVGRGSFAESFTLFGRPGENYEQLFDEKLELLLEARGNEFVTWSGTTRPPLKDAGVYPRINSEVLPIWIGVGGTQSSVMRAARLGLPMSLAIIGGEPRQFLPYAQLYRDIGQKYGFKRSELAVAISSNGFVGSSNSHAADIFYPSYAFQMNKLGRERGWQQMNRAAFDIQRSAQGALMVGSPEQVAERILYQFGIFNHQRFLLQMSVGTVAHMDVMRSIELYGTKVAPLVRGEIERTTKNNQTSSAFNH